MRVMFIATTNAPENSETASSADFRVVCLPDRGAILAMLKEQLAAYEIDDDVTDQKLYDLATEIASKRTLSGYDVTWALEMKT